LELIKCAKEKGIIVFNSAGNKGVKNPERQAIGDKILVCSTKSKNEKSMDKTSSFSNYGTGIDICAPGDPILSTIQDKDNNNTIRYCEQKGTSMAAPVAGSVAALI